MRLFSVALLGLALAAAACGGRNLDAGPGPLGEGGPGADSGVGGDGGMANAGGFGGMAQGGMGGAGVGGGAGQGGQPPNPINCLTCAAQNCPEAVACVTDQACVNGLVCAVSECLNGGNPDFMCLIGCFDGDFEAAQNALAALTCLGGTCAAECAGLLPF